MKKIIALFAITASLLIAADPVIIGTGGEKGSYFGMGNDIAKYCSKAAGTDIQVVQSTGSIENLTNLTNKKTTAGIVQADVLMSMAATMPLDVNMQNLKVIAGLHVETIHLLVPTAMFTKQASTWAKWTGTASNVPVKVDLETLRGSKIASYGGSLVSATALRYFFNLDWDIVNMPLDQMLSQEQMPILLVGGAPYKPVEDLLKTGKYRLINLDADMIKSKQPFYTVSNVSYTVNGEVQNVKTVGVQAVLIGKNYRSVTRNETNRKLLECIDKNLGEFADDSSTNPNWASVYENSKKGLLLNWPVFDGK